MTAQLLDGATVATPTYDAAGDLTAVSFPTPGGNGSAGSIARDGSGRVRQLDWRGAGNALITSDAVMYSQSGKVIDQQIDGTDADPLAGNFRYDAVGRLVRAAVPGHVFEYEFASSGGCGANPNAGRNTNRTALRDNGAVVATYCYDHADRLTSTTDARVGQPGYDGRGNTTSLGEQRKGYDESDRHLETTTPQGKVSYERDALDRIVTRLENGVITARYSYSGTGDAADVTLDAMGNVVERTVGLLGGVMLTKRGGGDVWSYPNIHGDVAATANAAGAKQGATAVYEPYGQPLTLTPDNSAGSLDYAWLGQHQRPYEHGMGITAVEMGARLYNPLLGRFLEVDPVLGGSENDYEYTAGDPINSFDLDGMRCWSPRCAVKALKGAAKKVAKVARNPVFQAAVTVAACSTGVGCGLAIGGFVALNAHDRGRKHGFTSRNFVLGTAADVALASLPIRNLRSVMPARAVMRPLTRANWATMSRQATRMVARRNLAYGGLGIARSYGHPDY